MSTSVRADEAASILGVSRSTLYAYVSRGLVSRRTAVDGRTSLYDRDEVEQLARRSRRRGPVERPTIDVRISSAITELHDDRLVYRGYDAAELAATCSFEQVAELLWTGSLPPASPRWPVDVDAARSYRAVAECADAPDALTKLALAATTAAAAEGSPRSAADAARAFLAVAPTVLGGPVEGTIAERVTAICGHAGAADVTETIGTALCLLADHELATSTLAVRVACSVRAHPLAALATGLLALGGPLHGTASTVVADLFDEAERDGAAAAVTGRLARREHLPGFGHKVYRAGDPRLAPLMASVSSLDDAHGRLALVEQVHDEATIRIAHQPNVDFAIGALLYVADVPRDHPLFAIARLAGWAAHYDEEATERPVRYRGTARSG